ncbi:MAG: hypothetical protein JWP53_2915, partial [Conexibacter sp.]|nr:hypothetical protein [Conexibacter sp.]
MTKIENADHQLREPPRTARGARTR